MTVTKRADWMKTASEIATEWSKLRDKCHNVCTLHLICLVSFPPISYVNHLCTIFYVLTKCSLWQKQKQQ